MHKTTLEVLLVEDDPLEAQLIQRAVRSGLQFDASITWVETVADAVARLSQGGFHVVLTDLGLPDSSGVDTVFQLRECCTDVPIIAMTALDGDGLGIAAISNGANDYVPKANITAAVLGRAIDYSIARHAMQNQLVEANRQLERQNERLEQLYKLSQQFVDNVSHEFRTPLTVIREFSSILRDGIDGPVTGPQVRRLTALINRTDDLATMVDDLLDTSRLEAGLLRTCRQEHHVLDIIQRVQAMLKTRAESKRIQLLVGEISSAIKVFCDEEKFSRILVNLIVNAIKFTPVDGRIDISISEAGRDRIRVTVADSGPGIAADDLKIIFERFKQVAANQRVASCRGFGLGLSIARALASLNLGALEVDSELGKGSRFSVLVPIADSAAILRCYLEQRREIESESSQICVVEVYPEDDSDISLNQADGDYPDQTLDTIDEFLSSSVRATELVLRTHASRWLVFICQADSVRDFELQVAREWSDMQRNHYRGSLPNLSQRTLFNADTNTCINWALELAPKSSQATTVPNQSNKSVLIVDDEVELAEAIELRLRSYGYQVGVSHNGATGIAAVTDMAPDAVLLDMNMPDMDGLTVLKRLKSDRRTCSTPVIAFSASLRDKHAALAAGASFFIQKPFQSNAIVEVIEAAIK